MTSTRLLSALTMLVALAAATSAQAQTPSGAAPAAAEGLPGGASSLQENFDDWVVACTVKDKAPHCAVVQQQAQQNGQRVLMIQLTAFEAGGANGAAILPLGLQLEDGVTLTLADKPFGKPLRFQTCLPAGCVAPLSFDAAAIKTLRTAPSLRVDAVSANRQPVQLTVSLKGFSAALDRAATLNPAP